MDLIINPSIIKKCKNYIVILTIKIFVGENNLLNINKTEINIHGEVIK